MRVGIASLWVGYMRGGKEGVVYLGSIGVSNNNVILCPVVKCTISEYILLSRFKCPVGFLHIIFSIPFIPIYQSKGRLSWTIKDTFCSRPSSKEGSRMESKGIRVINCQYQLQAALPY